MRSPPCLAGRNLLSLLAGLLVHVDPLRPATAIVVLGGGSPAREWAAAALFRAGWAPRVVLVRELGKAWPICGGRTAKHDERVRALVEHGVPRSNILVDARGASTTLQELERVNCFLQMDDAP
ncbi:MAG: YdcF family protein, partial [Chloroflexi bacterium]|nr:YdcF family protein [Chloroflexota bacterium]